MPSLILAWALLYPGGCIPIYIRAESLNSEVKRACEIELVPAQHESCFCTIGPGQQLNISSTIALSFSWGNCLKMLSALVRRLMFSGLGKNGTKDTRCKPNLLRLCSLWTIFCFINFRFSSSALCRQSLFNFLSLLPPECSRRTRHFPRSQLVLHLCFIFYSFAHVYV